jgi:hypothetical protein
MKRMTVKIPERLLKNAKMLGIYDTIDNVGLSPHEFLRLLCRTYGVPEVELEVFYCPEKYLSKNPNGCIWDNGLAGAFHRGENKILLLVNSTGTTVFEMVLHEFYHYIDLFFNGRFLWSTSFWECNNEGRRFAEAFVNRLNLELGGLAP